MTPPTEATPRPGPKRKLVLALALAAATWLLVETIAYVALGVVHRTAAPLPGVRAAMAASAAEPAEAKDVTERTALNWGDYVEVLHPYFGYVADAKANKPAWDVGDLGFIYNRGHSGTIKRSPDRLVVAVFGGSFGNGLYLQLKARLEARAAALGKQVDVANFTLAGYKQPQQLLVLSYLLALGYEFDVVINIDGFNDVALGKTDNVPAHVNPFFPRAWDRRTANLFTPAELRQMGAIEVLRERRAGWARTFRRGPLAWSPTLCLLWEYGDRAAGHQVYRHEQELARNRQESKNYTMTGPVYTYVGDDKLFKDMVDVWANGSIQMNALCAAQGMRYYHFLQPNQYVPNSKPMDAAERTRAVVPGHPFQEPVLRGYPLLEAAGARLKAHRVAFTDLVDIFKDVREPLYIDDCCHLSPAGYDIVAQRIYDVAFAEWEKK